MQKPKLDYKEMISHLKNKGITFNFMSEHEAIKVLQSNNYLFKLMSYRTNFNKKNGKYENLDFAMLSDLATIDMALRYLILKMSLDYEHAVKVKILDLITLDDSENGYAVVEKFKNESPKSYHIALNYLQKNNYQQVFYRKHNENIAVWSLLEILPFGSLSFFIEFYYKLTNYSQLKYAFHLTKLSKNLRNASAHNNPLLLNFYSRETRIKPSQTVYNIGDEIGISAKDLRERKITDLASLFYLHKKYCSSGINQHRKDELLAVLKRATRHKDWYSKNDNLIHIYQILSTLVNFL